MTRSVVSLRGLRTGIALILAFDVAVLLVFSVGKETVTRMTSKPIVAAIAAPDVAGTRAPSQPVSAPALPPTVVAPIAVTPPTAVPQPSHPAAPTHPSASPTPTTPTPAPPDSGSLHPAACPITITKRTPPNGGLQSLISFAPAFGDFSAEAFASAAAYQPLLQLLGPILAQYPAMASRIARWVDPLVNALHDAANVLYALLGPLYSPYRSQILHAETKLAAALAPYSEKLAESALGGCVVQLETALVQDTQRAALTR